MIKTFTIIFIFTNSCCLSLAQNKNIDSLKTVLAATSKPIERFGIINTILEESSGWKGEDIDSAACIQLLQISQNLNNDSLLAISYNWLGSYFYVTKGDNITGLEYYFKAIPLAEKSRDKRRISSVYFDIALVYFNLQNNEESVKNTRLGKENLPDKTHPLYDFMLVQYQDNMAQYFLIAKQPDSALYFAKGVIETANRLNGLIYNEFSLIGAAYAQKGDQDMATVYFKKANTLKDLQSNSIKLTFYNYYIPFLLANNRIHEAGEQSKELLILGKQNNNSNLKLAGAGFLRQVFDTLDQIDSAYYYSRMEASINELIYTQNNRNKIQALAFNEQVRGLEEEGKKVAYQNKIKQYLMLAGLGVFLLVAVILFRNYRQKLRANKVLEMTLTNLKATQSQLIQSEKMASLGELTAGIAHEIQNPLNFVNNFSEVNKELVDELQQELKTRKIDDAIAISNDIKDNEEKISHHGKRADAIVKGMLQHSKSSTGQKEPTDINTLADEYLRLAYHGFRAKDKSFNANLKTEFDESIGKINIIPQDMGRVILNLINNAFYAVDEKKKSPHPLKESEEYEPVVTVTTKRLDSPLGDRGKPDSDRVEIRVADNGNGIPQKVLDKIFQPFFTTKPTGQGTGLGLSLSYDIVKAHGGELKVETKEGEGAEFIIQLPIV